MAENEEGQPGTPAPAPPEGTPPADPMAAKLEGDKVPEKFRGKTLADVVSAYEGSEAAKTKAEQEAAQWRAWGTSKVTEIEAREASRRESAPNPLDAFNEDQQKALLEVVGKGLQPVVDGLSSLMKEVVKSNRPDFNDLQDKATEYFNKMAPEYRVHPEYGWDYAYRMAKAETLKGSKNTPTPPQPGPTSVPPPSATPELTADQRFIAQRFGLTDAEYLQFQSPVDVTTLKKGK